MIADDSSMRKVVQVFRMLEKRDLRIFSFNMITLDAMP
jgi:hypothetical protein